MITQLRNYQRVDRFLNDVRANQKKRRNYGRYVYLATVFGVFLYVINLFIGPFLWLKAEGLVVSDYIIIASPYEVQVTKIVAQQGQRVMKGDVLAQVHSPQVAESVASLMARAAETTARQAEIAIKLEVANTVMKTADERLASTEDQLRKVNASRNSTGFVSDAFIAGVQKDRYAAMQEKASREAERRAAVEQLIQLERSQAEARAALESLRTTYNGGIIVAPAEGTIGPKIVVQGDVIKPGDHLMQLYVGPKYALVYLETGTLYETHVGDRVKIADGFKQTNGTISEVLPLTMPVPAEFQKVFRPPTRGQIAKITLDDGALFPMSSKVAVTGSFF
jgi:multidrug resistance efflux pump